MDYSLCHTCRYEHSQIRCSGCEHDNDEYVCAEWFTKKEAEIRTDEREKFAKWLDENGYMRKMDLNISRVKEALYEYDKQIKGEQK